MTCECNGAPGSCGRLLCLAPQAGLSGRILITGGTGSLGQAIVRRAKRERWACEVTVYSRDEVKQGQMRAKHPTVRYLLGDVRDREALDLACAGQDIVIHAEAYKQVPSAEVNAYETVKTNVCGSCNVAMAAVRAGVKHVVGISTDKGCKPVNAYGKSKAIMEAVFQQANGWGQTTFHLTRYGNVIGSRGSIIPLFQRQAAAGGPLTVTDRRMTRFWLTLTDAVDLILAALAAPPGVIVVPRCPTMSVVELAEAVWQMHEPVARPMGGAGIPRDPYRWSLVGVETWEGNEAPAPYGAARISDIGIRPGEKLHEHLLHSGEALHAEDLPSGDVFHIYPPASGHRGNLPDGFEYRTDTAGLTVSIPAMQAAIRASEQEEKDV